MGRTRALAALLLIFAAGCGGGGGGSGGSSPPLALATPSAGIAARGIITHVIVIVQENRTFDNLFGGYAGGPAAYPGADSAIPSTIVADGLAPSTFAIDPPSNAHDWFRCLQVNGFADSIWADYAQGTWPAGPMACPTSAPPENPDTGVGAKPSTLSVIDDLHRATYWNIAHQFEIGDNFWSVESADSFAGHQYIVALQSINDLNEIIDGTPVRDHDSLLSCGTTITRNDVHTPTFDFSTGFTNWQYEGATGACWGAQTFGDRLDQAKVDWHHYSTDYVTESSGTVSGGVFNGFINYRAWYPKTKAIPGGRFRKSVDDLQGDIAAHTIGSFAWVKPPCIALSDHPGATHDPYGGQDWVASAINWIGSDAALWPHTVVFVVWDDWGGFYDHAVLPQTALDSARALTPGLRQPFLVISAYGKRAGAVSHSFGTYASVLKFVEDLDRITPLGELDASAPDLNDYFDFSKPPAPFSPVPLSESNFSPSSACRQYVSIAPYDVDR